MKFSTKQYWMLTLSALILFSGCTSVSSFPSIARPGDTVSVMIGGSEKARKTDLSVTFTDAGGNVWDLQALGLVRSVFNLRTDGRAYGQHYSSFLNSVWSWTYGHEPLQTMLVADLPSKVSTGNGNLSISMNNIDDNSSGVSSPYNIKLEVIPGIGTPENFKTRNVNGTSPVDFSQLEAAPHAKVIFGSGSIFIGAASLVIDFNETILNPSDLNIYTPESEVRGSIGISGAFGATQRMIYWHQDGQKLFVDIIAPQGIDPKYLQFFVVHPRGLSGSPAFNIISSKVYDTSGSVISLQPTLTYFP